METKFWIQHERMISDFFVSDIFDHIGDNPKGFLGRARTGQRLEFFQNQDNTSSAIDCILVHLGYRYKEILPGTGTLRLKYGSGTYRSIMGDDGRGIIIVSAAPKSFSNTASIAKTKWWTLVKFVQRYNEFPQENFQMHKGGPV